MSRSLKSSKFAKFGIPFFILVVGGSFGLKHFTSIRYEFGNQRKFLKESIEKKGINMKSSSEVSLESEYDKIKELDIDNWENKRGPRPWEEDNELYLQAVERARELEMKKAKQLERIST